MLLSGGSGKRLWPLSNEIRSKAFLRLLPTENGGMESMIERVCRGLDEAGLLDSSCIVTHRSQVEITRKSVGNQVALLAEPQKRGTFTAVALAASYLHSVKKISLEEIVVVIPVDSYVEASFFSQLRQFPSVLSESQADIALIGVTPEFPSTQFGYILPSEGSEGTSFLNVKQFAEKPGELAAAEFISRGGLWNCGVFSCSLGHLLSSMVTRKLPVDYTELVELYDELPERSFDYEVLEHTQRAVVIPYTGVWADIGSWDALTPHLQVKTIGRGSISEDSKGTYLVNELSCPVHVIGAPGLIVAAGADGILVAGIEQAKRIKQKLEGHAAKPMIEEKRWGSSRILDFSRTAAGVEVTTSKITMLAGKHTSYHFHRHTKEIWSLLSGDGEYRMNGVLHAVTAGDTVTVPAGARHGLRAITPLELIIIELVTSPDVGDYVRVSAEWAGEESAPDHL
ncbi:sugar phosphate nucleotidyltransferase [Paenibacillus sp. FSL K6-2859]|uniref:sugar phosphate nucleotidyltransferase n=1 Tax=Paenibacillus sp. FSL K6-2859 TaxID=2921482 RepID=UPI0030F87FCF